MADIYCVTIRSSELPTSVIHDAPYSGGYAEISERTGFRMPISEILRVTINKDTNYETVLSASDYDIYTDNPDYKNSSKEVLKLVANSSYVPSSITIEYIPYPDIDNIQREFDSGKHKNVYGDILIKHSYAVYLDFNIQFASDYDNNTVIDAIWKYIDNNNTGTFSINEMIRTLYNDGTVSNVKEPIVISYEKTYKDQNDVSGSFDSTISIKDIEYLIARNLTVERM
jgi:hypothetical protein